MQAQAKLQELKTTAAQQFLAKDYAKALETYDQAAKMLSGSAPEKADLLQKKAGCLMNLKKCVMGRLWGWCVPDAGCGLVTLCSAKYAGCTLARLVAINTIECLHAIMHTEVVRPPPLEQPQVQGGREGGDQRARGGAQQRQRCECFRCWAVSHNPEGADMGACT